ncbi:hypothetical protein [Limnoglobus roseus]|uniref:SWIM zinc finger family protein n=1 Tax=Limnoglobus roseus TaxID=2598579 RepID=A0A5C1AGK9_9BACT|nr:hypothetical protein [Limnoglobus roseus]QEL17116.1 SWIM zinc finger family protein [Limnoglobus roseus]
MNFAQAYLGRSGVRSRGENLSLAFAPNLRRDRVSFVGNLKDPLRFREAVSALHAVVVSDLKFKPKDRSAYQAYLKRVQAREASIRQLAFQTARKELLDRPEEPLSPDLERQFDGLRAKYWGARQKYSNYLAQNDPALFRILVPCDPVITVAPDVLFFECFSKDESSYGCLTADRDAFEESQGTALGTTNVDYSLPLYEEFQRLRTYRRTEFAIDPSGFEVATEGSADFREEKIDLPPAWLRGFMQLQAAMSLPMRKVTVSREGLYNLLAYLKKHRARKSPRSVRFELNPGSPVELVIEPWEARITLHDHPYAGDKSETIRVWGRDRLLTLARLLSIADGADVFLMGTGLPSFWSVRLGGMRFLLGLSGWTANDWTSGGGALADLAPPVEPSEDLLGDVATAFRESPTRTFAQVQQRTGATPALVAAGLNRFALLGQLVNDLAGGVYRWRQILPVEASLKQVRFDSPEAAAAREIVARGGAKVKRDDTVAGLRSLVGQADGKDVEALLDADDKIIRGQCSCSHYFRFKLRAGPCRHMQALRRAAFGERPVGTVEQWFRSLRGGL